MTRSKKTTREPSKMVRVDEAMEILSVSKSTAYHTIQKFNNELRAKGYEVPRGRVPRSYFIAYLCCISRKRSSRIFPGNYTMLMHPAPSGCRV